MEIRLEEDRIISHYIQYFPEKKELYIKDNLQIVSNKHEVDIFAGNAYYNLDTGYGYMLGSPKIISYQKNIILLAEKLELFSKKKEYVASGNIRISLTKKNLFLMGKKCVYKLKEGRVILSGNPIIIDKKNKINYLGKEIHFYVKEDQLVLKNEASIEYKNKNIKILADQIDIFTKEKVPNFISTKRKDKNESIIKLIMTGNVTCYQYSSENSILKGKPYRILNANKMTYYKKEDSIYGYLKGNAKIMEYYVVKKPFGDNIKYIIKKRGGRANQIDYQLQTKQKDGVVANVYYFKDNVFIFDYDKIGFSDEGYLFHRKNKRIFSLKGNAIGYDLKLVENSFTKILDNSRRKKNYLLEENNEIETKLMGEEIKYYIDKKEWNIQKGMIQLKDIKASGNYIHYKENEKRGYIEGNAYLQKKDQSVKGSQISFIQEDKIISLGESYYKNKDIEVWADEINYDNSIKKALIIGNIQFYYEKVIVNGNKLIYQNEGDFHKIYVFGSDLVGIPKIRIENSTLSGNFIEYNSYNNNEESIIYLDKNVHYESKKNDVKIQSDNMVFYNLKLDKESKLRNKLFFLKNYEKNFLETAFYDIWEEKFDKYILAENNVKIENKDGEIYANQGEYFIYPVKKEEKGIRQKLLLKGNCEIYRKDFSGTADRIFSFFEKDEKYLLNGNVELSSDKQFIRSNEIYYFPNKVKGNDITLLGLPMIELNDSIINGEKIKIEEKKKDQYEIQIFDNGLYKNLETHIQIKSDYFFYDLKNDVLKARGNVNYFDSTENVIFYSDYVSRYTKDKVSIISGNIQIKKGDETRVVEKESGEKEIKISAVIYGEQAKYSEKTKRLELIGNASFLDKGNISVADKIEVDVKGENLKIISVESGQFDLMSEEERSRKKKEKEK